MEVSDFNIDDMGTFFIDFLDNKENSTNYVTEKKNEKLENSKIEVKI